MPDQESMERYYKEKAEFDKRVANRIHGTLTPKQLESFKAFQSNFLEMMKAQMKMSASMLGGGKG